MVWFVATGPVTRRRFFPDFPWVLPAVIPGSTAAPVFRRITLSGTAEIQPPQFPLHIVARHIQQAVAVLSGEFILEEAVQLLLESRGYRAAVAPGLPPVVEGMTDPTRHDLPLFLGRFRG